eukprot:jgi/Psemu1/3747/gm1.3747_g
MTQTKLKKETEMSITNFAFTPTMKNLSINLITTSTETSIKTSLQRFAVSINDKPPIFTKQHVLDIFANLCSCNSTSFNDMFAIDDKLSSKQLWWNHIEHKIFSPIPNTDPNALSIDFLAICAITALCTNLVTSELAVPHSLLHMYLQTLGSPNITPAEQTLGNFTHNKLRHGDNWLEWHDTECNQLDQFLNLDMHGNSTKLPKGVVLICPHWQYFIHKSDTFAHSLAPNISTYISVNNVYADWCEWTSYNKQVGHLLVLYVQQALQEHINHALASPELGFKFTVNGKCIYRATLDGKKILMLYQVDDFCISWCTHKSTATGIYVIVKQVQHVYDSALPFKYLGIATFYSAIDLLQAQHPSTQSPLHHNALDHVYVDPGLLESTTEHLNLQNKHDLFYYHTLIGELLYAYTTCCPNIGFATSDHLSIINNTRMLLLTSATPNTGAPATNDSLLHHTLASKLTISLTSQFHYQLSCIHSHLSRSALLSHASLMLPMATSTEAELYAAVAAVKHILYLCSILADLGYPQKLQSTETITIQLKSPIIMSLLNVPVTSLSLTLLSMNGNNMVLSRCPSLKAKSTLQTLSPRHLLGFYTAVMPIILWTIFLSDVLFHSCFLLLLNALLFPVPDQGRCCLQDTCSFAHSTFIQMIHAYYRSYMPLT